MRKPYSNLSPSHQSNVARIAKNGFATSSGVSKSAKVELGCHLVFNQADDASDNRAGNGTPDRLAGEYTDVDIVARPGHHGNERTKELTTTDASDYASNRVAKRAQTDVLRCCARCIAANCTSNKLPMIRLMIVADVNASLARECSTGTPPRTSTARRSYLSHCVPKRYLRSARPSHRPFRDFHCSVTRWGRRRSSSRVGSAQRDPSASGHPRLFQRTPALPVCSQHRKYRCVAARSTFRAKGSHSGAGSHHPATGMTSATKGPECHIIFCRFTWAFTYRIFFCNQ